MKDNTIWFVIYGIFITTVVTIISPALSQHIILALILGLVTKLVWDKEIKNNSKND